MGEIPTLSCRLMSKLIGLTARCWLQCWFSYLVSTPPWEAHPVFSLPHQIPLFLSSPHILSLVPTETFCGQPKESHNESARDRLHSYVIRVMCFHAFFCIREVSLPQNTLSSETTSGDGSQNVEQHHNYLKTYYKCKFSRSTLYQWYQKARG
jgi:hypothetical protein